MDTFQQLLGNPSALQALLQSPQLGPAPPSQEEDFTRLPFNALQQDGGVNGPLSMLTGALGAGGAAGGPQPMDEQPAADEDAPSGGGAGGVFDAMTALKDEPGSPLAMGGGTTVPGLGADLQENMGLGAPPHPTDDDAPGYTPGGGSAAGMVPAAQMLSYAKMHPRPVAPELDERTLYPSGKRAALQGVLPGIAALIAGLTGGKMAAAGVMQGAHAGNEAANQDLKERGLLHYRQEQQRYARDTQSWQDDRQEAEQHAQIIAQLAEKARGMKPEDAKAWLQSQVKTYAPLGINPLDALETSQVGADDKRRADIAERVKTALNWQIEQAKAHGDTVDVQKLIDSQTLRIDGVTKPMRQWMEIADMPTMDVPKDASISTVRRAVNAEVKDLEDQYMQSTGTDHIDPTMHLQFVKDAWAAQAKTKENARELQAATLEHLKASTDAAKAQAWRARHPLAGMTQGPTRQQDLFAKSRLLEMARNPQYQLFVKQGTIFQNFLNTYNNLKNSKEPPTTLDDQTLMAEFIRAKHPGVNVITEADALRLEQAHPGKDSLEYGYNRVMNGQLLQQWQRDKMLEILQSNYDGQLRGMQILFDHTGKQIESRGMDPSMYMPEGLGVYEKPLEGYWTRDMKKQMAAEEAQATAGFAAVEKQSGMPSIAPDGPVNPLGQRGATPAPTSPSATPAVPATGQRVPIGTVVEQDGKKFRITGYDEHGKPQGDPLVETTSGFRYLFKGLNPFGQE